MLLPDALRQKVEPNISPDVAYAAPTTGTAEALKTALQPVVAQYGARVESAAEYLDSQNQDDARIDQVALLTVVGLAVLYTAISIANTCIMAVTGRFRDFAVLRLSGATRKQILRMVTFETLCIALVALVAAAVVTAAALGITYAAADPRIVMPWPEIIAIVLACFGIALITSIISTLWAFRTPAIRIVASRE